MAKSKNKRSLCAVEAGAKKAMRVFSGKAWTYAYLGAQVKIDDQLSPITEQTVRSFLGQEPIDRLNFVGLCNALALDWQEICGEKEIIEPELCPTREEYIRAIASAQHRVWISQTWLPGVESESSRICGSPADDIRLLLLSFKEGSPIYGRILARGMEVAAAHYCSAGSTNAFKKAAKLEHVRFNYGHHPGWIAVIDDFIFCGPTPVDAESHNKEFLFQKYLANSKRGHFWITQFEAIWDNYSHSFEEEQKYNSTL